MNKEKQKLKPPSQKAGIDSLLMKPGAMAGMFSPNADQASMGERLGNLAPQSPAWAPVDAQPAVILTYLVGQVVDVPLHNISVHELNARVHYSMAEIDEMAGSLIEHGQEVAARGYVDAEKVVLIDGQKRLKGALAGSLKTLRVEICEKPESPVEIYLESRRINVERSTQTVLDDAQRFRQILDQKLISDQKSLAEKLKISETTLSQTLAINSIPDPIVKQMKERPAASTAKAAYGIARVFIDGRKRGIDEERLSQIALDLMSQIAAGELSGRQIMSLVEGRLEGPRKRAQPTAVEVIYGDSKGTMKMFPSKGEISFTVKDLKPEQFEELSAKLQDFFAQKKGRGS